MWCRGNVDLFNYIISWFAKPLQTGNRNGTAIVVYGEPGCGKGIIADFLKRYVYGHSCSYTCGTLDPLFDKFNYSISGKVLVHIEAVASIDKNAINNFKGLKSLITADKISVNKKYADTINADNMLNLLINTNNSRAVYIEDADRRYTIIDCAPAENREYYDKLCGIMLNDAAGAAYYNYLMNVELVDTRVAMMTDLKREIHEEQESYPEIRAFFESRPLTAANCEVKGGDLYDMFAAYCRDRLKKLRVSPANSKTFITECRRKGFVEIEPVVKRIKNKIATLISVKAEWCRPADETIIM